MTEQDQRKVRRLERAVAGVRAGHRPNDLCQHDLQVVVQALLDGSLQLQPGSRAVVVGHAMGREGEARDGAREARGE
jgi:hypothetical protein